MRHDPAAGAIVIMLRSLKMYGMAQAVEDLIEQGAPAFEACIPMRISRDWGSDFARLRALVSRHRGQPCRGRGQADRRLHGVRPDGRGQGVS